MEEDFWEYDSAKAQETVDRYKRMLKDEKMQYFDVYEFEMIVDYYRSTQQADFALHALELAASQHPNAHGLLRKRVEVLLESNRVEEAMPLIKKLLGIYPNSPEYLFLMGAAFSLSGQNEKARQVFEASIDVHDPHLRSEAAYEVGSNFLRNDQFEEAIHFLEKAVFLGLEPQEVLYDLGFCYEKMGDNDKSIDAYQRYLAESPMMPDVWYNLGIAYGNKEEFEKAIEAYEYALAINPIYPSAIFNLANAYASLMNDEKAIEHFEHYLKLDDKSAEAYLYLGQSYDNTSRHPEAWTMYERSLQLDDKNAETYFSMALHCLANQQFADSAALLQKCLQLDDTVGEYWLLQGNLHMLNDEVPKTISAYEKAVSLNPTLEEAWLNLSDLFHNAGQDEMATMILEKAYQFNYEKASINFRLAAYLLLENNEKGMQHLEEALQLDSSKLYEFIDWYRFYLVNDEVKQLIEAYRTNSSQEPKSGK